jgi:hypothetical protein
MSKQPRGEVSWECSTPRIERRTRDYRSSCRVSDCNHVTRGPFQRRPAEGRANSLYNFADWAVERERLFVARAAHQRFTLATIPRHPRHLDSRGGQHCADEPLISGRKRVESAGTALPVQRHEGVAVLER